MQGLEDQLTVAASSMPHLVPTQQCAVYAFFTLLLSPFPKVVKLGTEKGHFPVPPSDSDLAFLMYTSGTTGDPKVLSAACTTGAVKYPHFNVYHL